MTQVICSCKAVKKDKIILSIDSGCDTIEKIANHTRATLGGCKGKRCIDKIKEILKDRTKK